MARKKYRIVAAAREVLYSCCFGVGSLTGCGFYRSVIELGPHPVDMGLLGKPDFDKRAVSQHYLEEIATKYRVSVEELKAILAPRLLQEKLDKAMEG